MKLKFFIIVIFLLSSTYCESQIAVKSIGAGLSFGSSAGYYEGPNLGINGNLLVKFSELVDGEVMGAMYFSSTYSTDLLLLISANGNLHFNISDLDPLIIYGLVGANISYMHYTKGYYYDDDYNYVNSNNESIYLKPGLNLGFGGYYEIIGSIDLCAQIGYTFSQRHQLFMNGGLAYKF